MHLSRKYGTGNAGKPGDTESGQAEQRKARDPSLPCQAIDHAIDTALVDEVERPTE